ncbi:site-specific integrase [Cryobacterium sp. 10I1]|uniref:tyrosine-type recombinase/integrase n=1 Tax=unclassified Cryobacterium TaxID=2649013 RepID=UPI002AC99496|nr:MULTISPECIES: site-specific integrase [unclassified Cryobacterium]MEB0286763.1 site-specific integrase [Cryobacterium sp. 10S3]MEB0303734.1 site-specific integrase [Cryobacterium sp. 10I1]WPX12687.1 site-specific integrase [Cryobacterium sp. 10S3]
MPKKRSPGDGALFYIPSKNLWRGVIDIGFTPDGRRKQETVTSRTQRGARDKLNELKEEIKIYGAPLDRRRTVEQWASHWLETVCRPKLKPKPFAAYESVTRSWIVPVIGKKRMSLVKPSDVREVYQRIAQAGRSSSTALKAHNIMSAMFESARRDGIVGRNVVADVDAPRAAISSRDALPTQDAIKILAAASVRTDGTRWWTALLGGVRQGERLGATLDSLDLDKGLFTIQWSLTEARFEHGCGGKCAVKRGGSCPKRRLILADGLEYRQLDGRLCLVRPKSGKPRTFPLIPQLVEALRRYLAATADRPNPHGLIWRNPDGSPITSGQDSEEWRDLLLAAGVITAEQAKPLKDQAEGTPPAPTTHWARHTTATVLMELGVDARIIGEIVGHASDEITRRYQHVSSAAARDAMDRLGTHFAGALSPHSTSLGTARQRAVSPSIDS